MRAAALDALQQQAFEEAALLGRLRHEDIDLPHAVLLQMACRNETIASIVSGSHHDEHAPGVQAAAAAAAALAQHAIRRLRAADASHFHELIDAKSLRLLVQELKIEFLRLFLRQQAQIGACHFLLLLLLLRLIGHHVMRTDRCA